jgi:CSLREA domain-containing protein
MKTPKRSHLSAAHRRLRAQRPQKSQHRHGDHSRPLRFEPLEDRRLLAVVTVDYDQDIVDPADGKTSLREAIIATNATPGPDEINFDFGYDGPTTMLKQGELKITDSVTISGPGASLLTVDAQQKSTIFAVDNRSADVTITGMTLTQAFSNVYGGAIRSLARSLRLGGCVIKDSAAASGGAIGAASGALVVEYCVLLLNNALTDGGAIHAVGETTILSTQITDNVAGRSGGGVYERSADLRGSLLIQDCDISANRAENWHGGGAFVENVKTFDVEDSTFYGNSTVSKGGGLYVSNCPMATIVDSSLSNNTAASGGGISLHSTDAHMEYCIVTNNTSGGGEGGGIFSDDSFVRRLSIDSSTISNNHARLYGGGIYAPRLTLTRSSVSYNSAGDATSLFAGGGGIYFGTGQNDSYVDSCTISNNSATWYGGGIGGGSGMTFVNTTVSGNSSTNGGGMSAGSLTLRDCTITANAAKYGAAGGVGGWNVNLDHTIVAANHDASGVAPDVSSSAVIARYSLIGNRVGSNLNVESHPGSPDANGNLIGGPVHGLIDPMLGPLADNGGPTPTHVPLPGSPAIDAGDPVLEPGIGDTPEFDQRGAPYPRVVDARIDIGAVERLGSPFVVDTLTDESDGDYSRGDLSLREAIKLANAQPGADVIEFAPGLATPRGAILKLTLGELKITDSLAINGPTLGTLVLDASGSDPTREKRGDGTRLFNIEPLASPTAAAAPIEASISNLTLTNGDEDEDGGAIRAVGQLTLSNMQIKNNLALRGGGVFVEGDLTLQKSTFMGNHAKDAGGAIYVGGGSLSDENSSYTVNNAETDGGAISAQGAVVHLAKSSFTKNNFALGSGGAVAALNSSGILENCTFSDSSAKTGNGGSIFWQGGDLVIMGGTITTQANAAKRNGGGVYFETDGAANLDRLLVSGVLFVSSSGSVGMPTAIGNGGSIWAAGDVSIVDSIFRRQQAGGDGGAVFIASSSPQHPSIAVIENSMFSDNRASRGGALAWDDLTTMVVVNSAIYGNTARGDFERGVRAEGGGLFGAGPLVLAHSTVVRNSVGPNNLGGPGGGGIRAKLVRLTNSVVAMNIGAEPDLSLIGGGHASAEYSLIGLNLGSGLNEAPVGQPDLNGNLIGGASNGVIDPKVGDTGVPSSGSPLINAGNPTVRGGTGGLSEFDVRRAPFARVVDGRIDIGAYESQSPRGAFRGDFNGDGRVDGADFLVWQRGVGAPSANLSTGDATRNGVVDESDLAVWRYGIVGPRELLQSSLMAADQPALRGATIDAALLAEDILGSGQQGVSERVAFRPPVHDRRISISGDEFIPSGLRRTPRQDLEFESLDAAFATVL